MGPTRVKTKFNDPEVSEMVLTPLMATETVGKPSSFKMVAVADPNDAEIA